MHWRTRRIALGLLIATAMGRPLRAQQRSAIEAGVSLVRFADDSTTVLGPSLRWVEARRRGALSGTASASGVAAAGAAAGAASLDASLRRPLGGRWIGELGGEGSAVFASSAHASTTELASARLNWVAAGGDAGGWARASGHRASREAGTLWGRGLDVAAWRRWPRGELLASVTREWSMAQLFRGRYHTGLMGTVPVAYTEGGLSLRVEGDAASLDAQAGARHDPDAAQSLEPSFILGAAFWRTPSRAWTVSVARQLPDFVRGADALQAVTVGVRFREPAPAMARAERVRPVLQMVAGDDGMTVVSVRAAGARRVEIMGDFTDWSPVELLARDGTFERAMRVSGGSHRAVVRIDGGSWRPAANTPAVDDDLGGRVGLVVAP